MIDFHLSSERQEWCIMELLSFGLYLFSLVFLLFPFLFSCLSCDSFCWFPFRLFISVDPGCFFLSCFSSCCIYILSSVCFPPASIVFIRRFPFPVLQGLTKQCRSLRPPATASWSHRMVTTWPSRRSTWSWGVGWCAAMTWPRRSRGWDLSMQLGQDVDVCAALLGQDVDAKNHVESIGYHADLIMMWA